MKLPLPTRLIGFHAVVVALTTCLCSLRAEDQPLCDTLPIAATGKATRESTGFDRVIPELMRKWDIPGAAVAMARDGRVTVSRGYGWADIEMKRPVQPDSLFRIASVSKPITAAAILILIEREQLDLDAKLIDLLDDDCLPTEEMCDDQFRQITVRHLLHHTAGFDRDKSFDPMLRAKPVVDVLGTCPAPKAIIRFMAERPLDFSPGQAYAYSNFGYCLLGRIVEKISCKTYEEAVKELVLSPAGIHRMRLGRTRKRNAAEGEVSYYAAQVDNMVSSVFANESGPVASPYGRYYVEAMDAHGGWIASAIDLVRFATVIEGSRKPQNSARLLLKAETVRLIETRPAPPVSVDEPTYYGFGWMIRPVGGRANWWHAGSLPGTNSLLVRTHHGYVWAVVVNRRPSSREFLGELDQAMWRAAEARKRQ